MILSTAFYFILTLLLLIFVHEAGHFLVARWCGVKVLRFSFGFGKVLYQWRDRRGTDFSLSLLPLGGYVKFLDENEGPVAADERHQAFNCQPRWVRVAIILAGPCFNFLFAFILLWTVAVIGIKSFAPRIDSVKPGSIAALAHLGTKQEIIAIDGAPINSWRDVHYVLLPLMGSTRTISITVKSLNDSKVSAHPLPLAQWKFESKRSDLLESLGIVPLFPQLPVTIGVISPESPAKIAGLLPNDEIIAINDQPLENWRTLVRYVHEHPDTTIALKIRRQGNLQTVRVDLTKTSNNHTGYLGIGARPPEIPADWLRMERSGPVQALIQAWHQTLNFTWTTITLMGRTVTGTLSFEHLSGPIGIAKAAEESVQFGVVYYLFFIALLSISIGVLNLLPIPLLDGGHLLFELIEVLIRRPLANVWKMRGIFLGMLLVIFLTLIALYNDLA